MLNTYFMLDEIQSRIFAVHHAIAVYTRVVGLIMATPMAELCLIGRLRGANFVIVQSEPESWVEK